jgi:hypothetical protein
MKSKNGEPTLVRQIQVKPEPQSCLLEITGGGYYPRKIGNWQAGTSTGLQAVPEAFRNGGTNVYDFRIQSSEKSLLVEPGLLFGLARNGGWQAGSSPGRELCSDWNTRARRDREVHFILDPVSFKIGLAISIRSILMAGALITSPEPRL